MTLNWWNWFFLSGLRGTDFLESFWGLDEFLERTLYQKGGKLVPASSNQMTNQIMILNVCISDQPCFGSFFFCSRQFSQIEFAVWHNSTSLLFLYWSWNVHACRVLNLHIKISHFADFPAAALFIRDLLLLIFFRFLLYFSVFAFSFVIRCFSILCVCDAEYWILNCFWHVWHVWRVVCVLIEICMGHTFKLKYRQINASMFWKYFYCFCQTIV